MRLEICHIRTREQIAEFNDVRAGATIREIKSMIAATKNLGVERQSLRSDQRGPSLADETTLQSLGKEHLTLFLKDLGPQVGWKTVFLTEYAGPFALYALFYARPAFVYGPSGALSYEASVLCACWLFHYGKRLLETQFVHRFSNGTMPLANIFKNSSYYWGFACLIGYFTNHPLYTPPSYGSVQLYAGLAGFILCEMGNFSTHWLLRNLRPAGSKVRKVPHPTANPFTWLFHLVSCPNYTYEVGAWACFTLMSQTLTAGLFAALGFAQMSAWALKKHRGYRKEFKDYPKKRKAIIPFIL